jgi:hypothetical protein
MALDSCIRDACQASWESEWIAGTKNSRNCSGFVKAVASKVGSPLPGSANADALMDYVASSWQKVTDGAEAARRASVGELVIAGLKGSEHSPARNNGHVAIVIGGPLYRDKYPLCWCGSIGGIAGQSQGEKSTGQVWSRADRDNLNYYSLRKTGCSS